MRLTPRLLRPFSTNIMRMILKWPRDSSPMHLSYSASSRRNGPTVSDSDKRKSPPCGITPTVLTHLNSWPAYENLRHTQPDSDLPQRTNFGHGGNGEFEFVRTDALRSNQRRVGRAVRLHFGGGCKPL